MRAYSTSHCTRDNGELYNSRSAPLLLPPHTAHVPPLPLAHVRHLVKKLGPPVVLGSPRVVGVGAQHGHQRVVHLPAPRQLHDGAAQRVHPLCRRLHQHPELGARGAHSARRLGRLGALDKVIPRRKNSATSAAVLLPHNLVLCQLAAAAHGVVPRRLPLPRHAHKRLQGLQLHHGVLPRRALRPRPLDVQRDVRLERRGDHGPAPHRLVFHRLDGGGEQVLDEGVEVVAVGRRALGGVAPDARHDGLVQLHRRVHHRRALRRLFRLQSLHALV
mmetsp:Transcript_28246/g.69558  ORF Transcript_28246/g.69558 Transcript_28246/m.69558 type:complete len:274 (+) Transcript_28246:353-1174(+)